MDARAVGALVCCCLAIAGVLGGVAAIASGDTGSGASDRRVALQEGNASIEGYDTVHVDIELNADNGSAGWTVQYRYRLDENESAEAWERLRPDVEDRPWAYEAAFEERWQEELTQAESETGREMELRDVSVRTENKTGVQEYGFATFTFRWTGFALVEVNRIEVGDALTGFVFDDRTRLMITWPEEYNATAIEPEPDESREATAVWRGDQTDFVEGEPAVELIQTGDETSEEPAETEPGLLDSWTVAGALVLLAAVGLAGWWLSRDRSSPTATDGAEPVETTDADGGPPQELLSNEERVLDLLEAHDGRIKQQEVVSELGWTEAKTSQVVSDLRETGEVEIFRIGRENVLALPEEREE